MKKGKKDKVEGNADKAKKFQIPPPYLLMLQKHQEETCYMNFLEILKQVYVNLSLVDILLRIPKYAKYVKDIVEKKNRLT